MINFPAQSIVRSLAAVVLLASTHAAEGQTFPNKPVRLILGFEAGGSIDVTTRVVAGRLGEALGQQVVVENRSGAGGTIAAGIAAKATPDGYTLLLCPIASHAIAPALYKNLPYDHIRDFAPISLVGTTPNVLVVNPSLPARSVGEFIAYSRSNPGKIHYASSGVGTTLHLSMELFKSMTGVDVIHVPYKGGAPTITALVSGQVQAMCTNLPGQLPQMKSGKTRGLAVTTKTRSPHVPEIPTMIESGLPGFEVTVWYGMCAPARVPQAIVAKLNTEIVKALNSADLRQRLELHGVDAAPLAPAEFGAFIKAETGKWSKVVKDAGLRSE